MEIDMIKRVLAHSCIVFSLIFMVLWVLDRVNAAMHFLSRDVFKIPFLLFLILVLILAVIIVVEDARQACSSSKETKRK